MGDQFQDASFATIKERITATGNSVLTSTKKGILVGWKLVGGSTAATAVLRENGSSGTIIDTLKAAIDTVVATSEDIYYEGQLHVTLTGTGAEVYLFVK